MVWRLWPCWRGVGMTGMVEMVRVGISRGLLVGLGKGRLGRVKGSGRPGPGKRKMEGCCGVRRR